MEGFERFALGNAPAGGDYVNRPFDELGWQLFSGSGVQESFGILSVIDNGVGVDRGRAIRFSKTGYTSSGFIAGAGLLMPDNGWTKRIVSFFITLENLGTPTSSSFTLINPRSANYVTNYTNLSLMLNPASCQIYLGNYSGQPVTLGLEVRTHIEIHYDRTAQSVSLYVNGTYAHSVSGIAPSNFAAFQRLYIWPQNINHRGRPFVIDDFVLFDDVGTDDTAQSYGPCKVDLVVPNGSIETDFSPNVEMPNWQVVGELPINSTDFVSASSAGAKDIHTFANPLADRPDIDTIVAVQATLIGGTDLSSANVTLGLGIDGIQEENTTEISTAGGVIFATMKAHPVTGQPLKVSDLDDLQSGYAVGDVWPSE